MNGAAVRPGCKRTEVGVIPEDWDTVELRAVCSMKSGEGITSARIDQFSAYPCFGGNGLRGFTSRYTHDGRFALIGRQGALCGNVVGVEGKFFASEHAVVVTARKGVDIRFLTYVLGEMSLNRHAEASAQPGLSVTKVLKLPLAIPPTQVEQQAVSAVLSNVDVLLEGLYRLITKKRDLKQAALQQLLTGQRRLPGFSGTWGLKRLGDCLRSKPGYGINAPAVVYSDRLPTYIRITDISEIGCFAPNPKVSVDSEQSDQYVLREGDLVVARTGASVGKSYLYNQSDGRLVFAGFLIRLQTNPTELLPSYLAAFMATKAYWDWVQLMSMRSGQPGINGKEFAQLTIPLPPPLEQSAIATVISDMDAELAALEARRDKTRDLKQGMMQELLTGRIRLV